MSQGDETVAEAVAAKAIVPLVKKTPFILPVQLPILLYVMFKQGLTEDTLFSMVKGLYILVWMQVVYGYLLASTFAVEETKKKKSACDIMTMVVSATVVACVLANVIFVILILFGSPLYTQVWETYVLSYHLALILVQPVLVMYKLYFNDIAALFQLEHIYCAIFSNPILSSSALGVLGTWLGVIPIPLDWDRPWQQWPITLLVGGYSGAFIGSTLALVIS